VAVVARQEGLDPIGSCVGVRGSRINNIVHELNDEKIDIIQWSSDPATFVANALSPVKPLKVELRESDHTAFVTVLERQLSLAIGKDGQNARLAAKLTGWRVDVTKPAEGEFYEERRENLQEPVTTSHPMRRERGERSQGRHERNGRGEGGSRRGGNAHRGSGGGRHDLSYDDDRE
jgi:N utilization substance protein A